MVNDFCGSNGHDLGRKKTPAENFSLIVGKMLARRLFGFSVSTGWCHKFTVLKCCVPYVFDL